MSDTDPSADFRPAVFFDRDNTLIVADDYLGDPGRVVLMDGAAACVAGVRELGYAVVTVSNQSGVARGYYAESDVRAVDARMDELLSEADSSATVDHHDFCPHHPTHGVSPYRRACDCRKPADGMLRRSAESLGLDLLRSWCVGDAPRDVEAGKTAGCRTILFSPSGVPQSPAATDTAIWPSVTPDFRAASLAEVLEIIRRETPTAEIPADEAATDGPSNEVEAMTHQQDEPAEATPSEQESADRPAAERADDAEGGERVAKRGGGVILDAESFDEAFYKNRGPSQRAVAAAGSGKSDANDGGVAVVDAETPRPKVVIGSKSAASSDVSPAARKAGAAAKTPEQFQAEVAERARRLRERFGAIRSATQADDKPAEPVGEAPKPAEAPTEPEPEKAMDESPAATVNLNGDDAVLRPESPDEADAISAATLDDDGFEPAAKTVEEPSQPEPTPVRRISVAPKLSATPPPADAAETDVAGVAARAAAQAVSDRLERHQKAHADDFSFLRLFAGLAQVLALAAVAWSLLGGLDQPTLTLGVFLQLLALTFVMASRPGSL